MSTIYRFTDAGGAAKIARELDTTGSMQSIYLSAPNAGMKRLDQVSVGDTIGDDDLNGPILVVSSVERISRFVFVADNGCRLSTPVDSCVCVHTPNPGLFLPEDVRVGWSVCVMQDHANPVTVVSIETVG